MRNRASATVAAICLWRDYPGEEATGLPWSVSLEDADGEEISCDGGAETSDEAWERATELADDHDVPAKMIRESGEVIRSYNPPNSDADTEEDAAADHSGQDD